MTIIERLRVRFTNPVEQNETVTQVKQFSDGLVYGASKVLPYRKPVEGGSFPSVPIAGKAFMPPSMQPQMRSFRLGSLPSVPTAPSGSVNPHGSK